MLSSILSAATLIGKEKAKVLTYLAGRARGAATKEDLDERARGAGVVLLQGDQRPARGGDGSEFSGNRRLPRCGGADPHRRLRLPPSPRTGARGPELCLRKTSCAICSQTHAPFQALVSDIIGKFQ